MRIFVSYTLKDGYLDTSVLSQVKELYRNSDSCYIDILDNDSVDKQGRVEQELQSADVLLLIETPMVMESKWVRHELNVAKNRNILIIKPKVLLQQDCGIMIMKVKILSMFGLHIDMMYIVTQMRKEHKEKNT